VNYFRSLDKPKWALDIEAGAREDGKEWLD
jgi:hypothetical protein